MDIVSTALAGKAKKIAESKVQYFRGEVVPTEAVEGDEWYVPSTNVTYKKVNDGTSDVWVDISTAGGGAGLTEADLKTINGESIVGNGDITLSSGTVAPTLSTTTVSQTEGSSTEVTITNYNAALRYGYK
jgi:hypothetical protein